MIFIFLTFKQKKISSEEHKSQKNLKMLHNNHKKYLMCKIISTNNSFKDSHKKCEPSKFGVQLPRLNLRL